MRFLAWIAAGCAIGIGAALILADLGAREGGVWIGIAAAAVLVIECGNAVRGNRTRGRR